MKFTQSLVSLLLAVLPGAFTLTAQSPADSLRLHAAEAWTRLTSPAPGVEVSSSMFDTLCGAPQCLTLCRISPCVASRLDIGVSDTLATTAAIASASNAVVAVNGSYFDMSNGNSVCFIKKGKFATDSTTQAHAVNGLLRCRTGNTSPVEIRHWTKTDEEAYADTIASAIAAGPVLLLHGENRPLDCVTDDFSFGRHPRTAVGITPEGEILLLTADGRHPGNALGLTLPQLAWVMRQLGATDAINLDGGGSTALWTADNGTVSHPSDNRKFDNMGERPVPDIIYLAR